VKLMKPLSFAILALLCAGPVPLRANEPAVLTEAPDWKAVVGDYPLPGTEASREELAILGWLQMTRTRAESARIAAENTPSLGCFISATRKNLMPVDAYPATTALLTLARQQVMPIVRELKAEYGRPRPYDVHPALEPVLPRATTFSYPSTHAVLSLLYARILTQLDPGNRAAILERGRELGFSRVAGGSHWPSDVTAGQRLAKAYADWWISQPDHRLLIRQACEAEWHGRR